MNKEIQAYNDALPGEEKNICKIISAEISKNLSGAESKIWHAHPVWFLNGNPVTGYSKLKNCIRLLFWSGQSFEVEKLQKEGKFMAAEICYTSPQQIDKPDLERWLKKAREIQWDYENFIKRKGRLERLV